MLKPEDRPTMDRLLTYGYIKDVQLHNPFSKPELIELQPVSVHVSSSELIEPQPVSVHVPSSEPEHKSESEHKLESEHRHEHQIESSSESIIVLNPIHTTEPPPESISNSSSQNDFWRAIEEGNVDKVKDLLTHNPDVKLCASVFTMK